MALEAIFTRHHIPVGIQPLTGQQLDGNQGTPTSGWNHRVNTLAKSLVMDQRRQLGLCYRCGEKFSPGHQCKRQLLSMEGLEKGEEGKDDAGVG